MRFSESFIKTRKNAPAEETSKNAQLLIRAGFVFKQMAGVYAYLPLGLKVIENIKDIIREAMNDAGGQEIVMTTLQPKELWQKTGRWDDKAVDIWFKTKLQNGKEVGLSWSHEEPITDMMRSFVNSYKDLPIYTYQFQTKLRNELRAKSGLMRGREFLMKDLYSYSPDEKSHAEFYDKMKEVYLKIFDRVGLGDNTFLTFASGGAFTDQVSHEFQTVTENGEDTIYLDREKKIAVNKEVMNDDILEQLSLNRDTLEELRAAEVGNIFSFGSTKCEELGLYYTDENGEKKPIMLGSYGIGVSRLMGVIAEHFSDDKGLVWPESVAPAKLHLIRIGDEEEVRGQADKVYDDLKSKGVEVVYDDRNLRAGEMLADADLMGMPMRAVVSSKSLQSGGVELKSRTAPETEILSIEQLVKKITD